VLHEDGAQPELHPARLHGGLHTGSDVDGTANVGAHLDYLLMYSHVGSVRNMLQMSWVVRQILERPPYLDITKGAQPILGSPLNRGSLARS
jgi:hypothetical protein